MIKRFFILLLAIVASVGMSFAQDPGIVSSGTKGGMSYTFYDNGLLEISGSGALPGSAFTNWDGGFGTSVKNIRFAEDCEVYGLDYLWFGCYTENSQLETVEINSVAPIMFSGTSGAGIFYRQDGAVTLTITAPGIVDVENRIIDTYGSPVNMIFNMPATTVFEKKWFSGLENYFAVTIPTGAKGHIPAGYVFKDSYDQEEYDHLVADGYEEIFWDSHSYLEEGVDYTLGEESTFEITAENASQIFGKATVSFQAPTEASNSEWVLWRKSDLKTFSDMSSGDQKVYKDVTVKVNNGVYNTDSGWGIHFESLAEDGVQFVAPEGKVFKRIVILNQYGTFSDPNWSYDKNYKRWSGSADTVGFVGNICGISLIEFELGDAAPATTTVTWDSNTLSSINKRSGESFTQGDVTVTVLDGIIDRTGKWKGNSVDASFKFSTSSGNFTRIEITGEIRGLGGSGWTQTSPGAVWTGDANEITFGMYFRNVTQVEFTIEESAPDPAPPYEAAMNLINEIPNPVVLTAECKAKIDAARAAYDALSDGDKDLVTNIATLTTAEEAFENVMNIWLSGDCDVILWKDTTLTVKKHTGEGNGAMADYTSYYGDNTAPWFHSRWYNPQPGDIIIKSVTIEEGVIHLGDNAFGWMIDLKTVTIPASVTSIGEDAFYWSKAVDDIYLSADPSNLTWVLPHSADNQFKAEKATLCHVPADLLTAYQEKFGTLNVTFVGDLDPITPLTPEQQQALDAAKGLINAIPSPVVYTPACKDAIDAARAAYDALTPDMLKQLVSNYATLTAAEATYESLKDVAVAEAKIAAIPQPVTLKLATRDSIESARAAYDALTADQKLLVTNYDVLTAAEAAWAGLTNVAPAGALSGKYTINDGGDVIYFAHGNLQYTRENLDADWSTGTFRLAENQYDLIELVKSSPNSYCTDNYGDKTAVGLFGWGTWGEGKTPNLTSSDRSLYTWSTDFSGTLEGTDTWRTLTKDEWVYLLAHNNQSYATVHGVNGLLVAPDGKDIDGKSMADWVEINDETWTTMQNDGYLFLPACGQRSQLSTTANIITGGQGTEILYYSSTEYSNVYAHNIWYKPGQDPAADDYSNKRQAFGVRLVSAGVNPLDQVQVIKGLIEAIPDPVTLDDACVNAIQSARAGYDALDTDAKAILDAADVKKLTDAEAALTALNQAVADEVIAKINAIPTPVELKLATRDSINNARAAYDALNAAQQALVSNYQTLLDAETELASLNPGVPPATPLDSAQAVKDLIDAILTPVEFPTSGPAIAAALAAYNQLSDAAKGALDAADVQKLTDAAAAYEAARPFAPITTAPAAVAGLKYTGAAQALITAGEVEHGTLYYSLDGENWSEELPTAIPAGAYTVYYKVTATDDYKDVAPQTIAAAIAKADIDFAMPTAVEGLVYNSEKQALISAGESEDGTFQYKVGENGTWVDTLPKVTDASTYQVYYKIQGDANHNDYIAAEPLAVSIAKAALTITAENKEVVYGYAAPGFSVSYSGLQGSDLPADVLTGELSYACEYTVGSNAGEYDITPGGQTSANYDITFVKGKLVVYKADPAFTAPTANTLTYNGGAQTLIAAGTTEHGTFEYTFTPNDEESWNTALPQAKNADTYGVYYRVVGDHNHNDYESADAVVVTIAKAALTATADNKEVIYGDAVPAYTVTYAGWQGEDNADVLSGMIAYACEYAQTSIVGDYTITPSGVSNLNYTITFVNGKVTVSKAALTITADNKEVTYGDEAPAFTAQFEGFKNEDNETVVSGLTLTSEYVLTSNVGEYAIVPADATAQNYAITFVNGTLTVNRAALMITADDKEVTYGDEAPAFTASYEGWKNADDESVVSGLTLTSEYVLTSNVGEYDIVPANATAQNYAISYTNGTLTVNKAPLMITADDKEVIYGDEHPAFTASYEGWKNADDESVVSGLTLTSEYLVTSNVGTYDIVPANASATNYAISYTNGTLTVNQAALTITANDTTMIYGDEHPEFTASYSGWKNTDDESVVSGLQFSTPYAPGSYIGTYAINPNSATALNYAITFVDGTLTVNKAHVYVSDAEAQIAKFADGHANALVLEQGVLNGIKLNDPIAHVTTAAFSSADVAENLTITLFYELTGDAALLNNYNLDPTSDIFTTEGVIIEPFIPDNEEKPEDEEAKVNEGIEIYAYGYCDGSGYSLKYHLESGNPDQYKIDFADSRFTDVDWTNLVITGKDGTIDIEIPVDMPTGDYTMTVYFRDSRFDWLESRQFNVTFHVNLPETYVRPLFDNVIALVDTCECLTDIQWYWRANSTELWQPIEGANGYYYHVDGKLTGEYFVYAKMNGEPTYTCGQTDMETLYGETQKASAPVVKAYPNPVVTTTTVTIENSTEWIHNIRIVNLMGAEVMNDTFEGDKTSVEMGNYPQGNYMISVDGIVVKVMKQ